MLSIVYGLLSALVWGGADFAGGLASRSERPIRVVTLAETAGLVLLIGLFFLFPEPMPPVEVPRSSAGSPAYAEPSASFCFTAPWRKVR